MRLITLDEVNKTM